MVSPGVLSVVTRCSLGLKKREQEKPHFTAPGCKMSLSFPSPVQMNTAQKGFPNLPRLWMAYDQPEKGSALPSPSVPIKGIAWGHHAKHIPHPSCEVYSPWGDQSHPMAPLQQLSQHKHSCSRAQKWWRSSQWPTFVQRDMTHFWILCLSQASDLICLQ